MRLLHQPNLAPGIDVTRVEDDRSLWSGHSTRYGLTFLTRGAFDFWYRRGHWSLGVGALKLKEPGEFHRDLRVDAPIDAFSIAFTPELTESLARALALPWPGHFRSPVLAPPRQVRTRLRELTGHLRAPALDALAFEALVLELLADGLRLHGERRGREPPPDATRAALRRVRERLIDDLASNPSLDTLARDAGLNKFHLLRAFRAEYGEAPHTYRTHVRVAQARLLLARGVPIARVALDVGLYDQSQLHRHFRRIVGVTPGTYARAARKRASITPNPARSG